MMPPVKKIGRQIIATAIMTGMSNAIADALKGIPSGATRLEIPNTQPRLKMLLPTTLPTAMSRSPRKLATTEVTTSGNEVPVAMIVNPMTNSLTPHAEANVTAPPTNHLAPKPSPTKPPTIHRT